MISRGLVCALTLVTALPAQGQESRADVIARLECRLGRQ